jgi:hypothetical protein
LELLTVNLDRVVDDRIEQQPTSAENVGQRRDYERCEVTEADRGLHRSEMCLGDIQPVLNLFERKAQQGSIVVLENPAVVEIQNTRHCRGVNGGSCLTILGKRAR